MRTKRAGGKRASPAKLVAFDMDGVLIDHVSSWAAIHEALGTDNARAVEDFLAGRIDDEQFIHADVELWRAKDPDFSKAQMTSILRGVPRMRGMVEAVSQLRAAGASCVIISGGLRPLAEMLAAEVGFDAVRANGVSFGADGRLGGRYVVEVPLRDKGKVLRALQERTGIAPSHTASIGDSAFDIGLFRASAVSVAFNPKDDEVVRAATHTVRERDLRLAVGPLRDWLASER